MTVSRSKQLLMSSVVFAALLYGAGAQAQTAGGAPAASSTALGEVVVTAQRRSENLQTTPIAVTALSPQILEDRSVRTAQDLMQVAPSLQISTQTAGDGGGSATFFLRGLGQQRAGNGSQPAVGIYVDDFYYPSLEGTIFSILDIQQVEVLRGPQGTLFGRNTIGGAIRYTTKKPDQELGGYLSGTYGSFDRKDVSGAINVPLGDKAAVRVTAGSLNSDGFVKSALTGKDVPGGGTDLGRVQFRVQPTEKVTIDLQAQMSASDLNGFAYTLPGPFNRGNVTNIWNGIPPLGGAHPYDSRYKSACFYCQPGTDEYSRVRNSSLNGVVAVDVNDNITVKSLTGYTEVLSRSLVDLDGTILPVLHFTNDGKIEAFSQELQVNGTSAGGAVKWVSGLYYYNSNSTDTGVTTVLAGANPPARTDREIESKAAYLDVTWKATDKFSVLGGYRYNTDHQTALALNAGVNVGAGDTTFDSNTGRLGVQYQWTPDVMSYATISQGFRAGGFNRLQDNTIQSFRPETDTSYEIGGRFSMFDRRLRLNPTAFYTEWSDIQVQRVQYILDANGNPTQNFLVLFDNAAQAHTYGLEIEADAAITEKFHMFGHVATLEAKYDDTGGALGITTSSKFQRAPKLSYGLGASYTEKFGNGGSLIGTVNYSWQDEQASTPTDSDTLLLPSYGVVNLRLEYRTPNGHWSLAGFATNVTDEEYFIGGVNYPESSPHYDVGRPQEFGVTVKFNY